MTKPVTSLRLDEDLVKLARAKKINIAALTEEAIKRALKLKTCPYCGSKKAVK